MNCIVLDFARNSAQTKESHGGRETSFNTFSVSTSATCWLFPHIWMWWWGGPGSLWNNHITVFFKLLGSRATQAVHTHWGGCHLHATLTPAHLECCWKPITAPLIFSQSWHDDNNNTLCSSSPTFVLVSLEHLCTSSHVIVSLWFPCHGFSWLVNHKLIGLDTPLSFYHITLFQLCFPFYPHLFPRALEQTVSFEWLDTTVLTLCPLPFMLIPLRNVFCKMFYLFISIYLYRFLGIGIGITPNSSLLLFFCFLSFFCGGRGGGGSSMKPSPPQTKQLQHNRQHSIFQVCFLSNRLKSISELLHSYCTFARDKNYNHWLIMISACLP